VVAVVIANVWHREMLNTARIYGKLLESAFDVHRGALYESLRWPLPATPADEVKEGAVSSRYLWRGSPRRDTPVFTRVTTFANGSLNSEVKEVKHAVHVDGNMRSR
jgi:hypothetical protein